MLISTELQTKTLPSPKSPQAVLEVMRLSKCCCLHEPAGKALSHSFPWCPSALLSQPSHLQHPNRKAHTHPNAGKWWFSGHKIHSWSLLVSSVYFINLSVAPSLPFFLNSNQYSSPHPAKAVSHRILTSTTYHSVLASYFPLPETFPPNCNCRWYF